MSSTITHPQPDWNPMLVLEIQNAEKLSFTCVAHARSKGRRCRNPIAGPTTAAAKQILDTLPAMVQFPAALKIQLRALAPMAICQMKRDGRRPHQEQAESIANRWYEAIVMAIAPSPASSSEDSDHSSDDGRSAVGSGIVSQGGERDASRESSMTFARGRSASRTESLSASDEARSHSVAQLAPETASAELAVGLEQLSIEHARDDSPIRGVLAESSGPSDEHEPTVMSPPGGRAISEPATSFTSTPTTRSPRTSARSSSAHPDTREFRLQREQLANERIQRHRRAWVNSWIAYQHQWTVLSASSARRHDQSIVSTLPWPTYSGAWQEVDRFEVQAFLRHAPDFVYEDADRYQSILEVEKERWERNRLVERFSGLEAEEEAVRLIDMVSGVILEEMGRVEAAGVPMG